MGEGALSDDERFIEISSIAFARDNGWPLGVDSASFSALPCKKPIACS
jgi:hypothetical protein